MQATLRHLMERYGPQEVVQWPIEIWNEPNLTIFWRGADKEAYFTLFRTTFQAVKAVDSRFRVCGPAVCGDDDEVWIRDFLRYCQDQGLAVDAITRHHYTVQRPVRRGEYAYSDLIDAEEGVPAALFHGGFGLVTQGCIPKPTFWTFDFFRRLWPDALCRHRDPEGLVLERDGAFQGILWNLGGEARQCGVSVPARAGEAYVLLERLVDGEHGNPLKLWHDLGEPSYPTDALLQLLREAATPQTSSRRVSPAGAEQRLDFRLRPGAVLYFEFRPCPLTSDTGYRYEDAVLGRAIREVAP